MTNEERAVHDRLHALDIVFERLEHPAVATVEEGEAHWGALEAMHFKNLFVRNQKATRHYLLILRHDKRADLRAIAAQLGDGKLSFASTERLMTYLGTVPGAVSPFGLINDGSHLVQVVLDRDIESAGRVSFHPNVNTATLTLRREDFGRFLAACQNPVQYITVAEPLA
jgi:Ala-tRNA(Pro) deacylase